MSSSSASSALVLPVRQEEEPAFIIRAQTRKNVSIHKDFAMKAVAQIQETKVGANRWLHAVVSSLRTDGISNIVTAKKYMQAVMEEVSKDNKYSQYQNALQAFMDSKKLNRELTLEHEEDMRKRLASPTVFDGKAITTEMFRLLKESALDATAAADDAQKKKRLLVLTMALMLFSGRRKSELVLPKTRFVSLQNASKEKEFPNEPEYTQTLPYQCWFFGQLKELHAAAPYGSTSYVIYLLVPVTFFVELYTEFRELLRQLHFSFPEQKDAPASNLHFGARGKGRKQLNNEKVRSPVNLRPSTAIQRTAKDSTSPNTLRKVTKDIINNEKKQEKQALRARSLSKSRTLSDATSVNKKLSPMLKDTFIKLKYAEVFPEITTLHKFRHVHANLAYSIFEQHKSAGLQPQDQVTFRMNFLFRQLGHLHMKSTEAYAVFRQKEPIALQEWTSFMQSAMQTLKKSEKDVDADEADTDTEAYENDNGFVRSDDDNDDQDDMKIILPIRWSTTVSDVQHTLNGTLGMFLPAFVQHPTRGIEFDDGPCSVRMRFAAATNSIANEVIKHHTNNTPLLVSKLCTSPQKRMFGTLTPWQTLCTLQHQFVRDADVQMEVLRRSLLPFDRSVSQTATHVCRMFNDMNMHFVPPQWNAMFAGDSEASRRLTSFIQSLEDGKIKVPNVPARAQVEGLRDSALPTKFVKWLCQSVCSYTPR